jgi:hypothetical protein
MILGPSRDPLPRGGAASLRKFHEADPDVLNHNLETVAHLYPEFRPQAVYARSLELLHRVRPTGGKAILRRTPPFFTSNHAPFFVKATSCHGLRMLGKTVTQ